MTSALEDLHISPHYDGLIYLADSAYNPPILRPHQHAELEVNLVVRGSITYVFGPERYTFEQGSLLWLFPSQRHQMVRRSRDAQIFIAVFKPQLISSACRGEAYAGLKNPGVEETKALSSALAQKPFRQILRAMEALMEGALDPVVLNREAGFGVDPNFRFHHKDPDWLNAGLRQLLLLCWRNRGEFETRKGETQMHPAVRRALDVLANPASKVTGMVELAFTCGVSAEYLSRIFKQQVGVPVSQYRNSMKLGRFWQAYHGRSQKNLAEASHAAGFGSYAQFYRVFKDAYGDGPREILALSNYS
jgi:methylphosphotriester-DNA--protein-cysteine methyltransferase